MKAAVYEEYGPPEVLKLCEVDKPIPGTGEILVRVYASTVSSADHRARALDMPRGFGLLGRLMFGLRKPRQPILGSDLAGVVEEIGKGVTRFRTGDQVFASSDFAMGCHAEYRCLPETGLLARMPRGVGYPEAVALPFGGTTALHFFRSARLRRGEQVLINGASGAVGSAAVQLARHAGAEVTAVCSTSNLALVRSLGAAHVVDYTRESFLRPGLKYDVIVDTTGQLSYFRCKAYLREQGRLLLVAPNLSNLLSIPWVAVTSKIKVKAGPAVVRLEDLSRLARLTEEGHFRPVIDRIFPADEIVEAHRYVDRGHKKGNVVVLWGKP